MTHRLPLAAGSVLLGLAASGAVAQGADGGWSFTVAPYLWVPEITGNYSTGVIPPTDVDLDFSDLTGSIDGAFAGVAEARRGRLSFGGEVLYVSLEVDGPTPLGAAADEATVGLQSGMYTAYAGYALMDTPRGHLDAIGGLRYWNLGADVSLSGGPLDGAEASTTESWTDLLVGLKGTYDLSDRFYFTGWLMAGGLGTGSEHMYDAMASLGYRFNDTFSMTLGYRALQVDFQDEDFNYDIALDGWITGLVFSF